MIISQLSGGLGNQMFQYAAGRRLAEKLKVELKLDLSFFQQKFDAGTTPRAYALNIFHTTQTAASEKEINKLYLKSKTRFINALINKLRMAGALKGHLYKEKHFHFDPQVLQLKDPTLLFGYFQSEKYFIDIENIVRKEFTLKETLPLKTAEMAKQIRSKESVAIHIRRGDYITNKAANVFHGICGLDYYNKAVGHIQKKTAHPHFYVFSDDPEFVKANFSKLKAVTFMSDHVNKDYHELMLMSCCKHNIIANSSFSWWGAWLNHNPDKLVIAPKKWFQDQTIDTSDLIPKNWLRI